MGRAPKSTATQILDAALVTDLSDRLRNRTGPTESLVQFAMIDVPHGAVRPELLDGKAPEPLLDTLVEKSVRTVLSIPATHHDNRREALGTAKDVVRRAVRTSLHCSIASTNADGSSHVTPIGSVLLGDFGSAIYFDVFNKRLAGNIERDPRVTILAVNSGRVMWLRSLAKNQFAAAVSAWFGVVGPAREPTQTEIYPVQSVVRRLLRKRRPDPLGSNPPGSAMSR